ncbi:MAG: alpha-ketoglutarate-dependent dioxygenase AlkB [Myxococcota bacterium]
MQTQGRLFGGRAPAVPRGWSGVRIALSDTAFLDHHPGWLQGDDVLFDHLEQTTAWRASRREMYDQVVDVPRLCAVLPDDGPGHPVLAEAAAALTARYDRPVQSVSLALYRDGSDSVAFHGDRMGEAVADCIVALVSLRGPRRLHLRARGGGPVRRFDLGHGDLLVMGGSCQRDFEHAVPKVARAEPRLSVMIRSDRPARP